MKLNELVSIIVPVYNSELYLDGCLNDILNQTYREIEVILINDGSTDNSGNICDSYAFKDSRVRVFHKSNSGPSASRNKGIEVSKGKYLQFVDSDDNLELDMTEKLVLSMKKTVDLAICGYKLEEYSDKGKSTKESIPKTKGIYSKKEFLRHFCDLFNKNLINSPCNKLYLKEIIDYNNIRFLKDISMGEDLLFNLEYLQLSKQISIIPESLYKYNLFNTSSLTRSFIPNYYENQKMLFRKTRDFLKKNDNYDGEVKAEVDKKYINSIMGCFSNLFREDNPTDKEEILQTIKSIVSDEDVQSNIDLFFGDIQRILVGKLIYKKNINAIYSFYKFKALIKTRGPFEILKKINKFSS